MKKHLLILFCLFSSCLFANASTIQLVDNNLIAPEAVKYQWYLNGERLIGENHRDLAVKETGTYKVEIVNTDGVPLEATSTVAVSATGAVYRIFTIGDSTVQTYAAGYYPRTGWGQILGTFFNTANVTVTNNAVGGTSSKSFYNNYWTAVKNNLQAGDYVFIQFGINDRNNADTARYAPTGVGGGTPVFENYLTKFVTEARAKGAIPVLVATLRRNAWNADGTVYDAYHDHPIATRNVAKTLSVPLIDLDAKAKVLLESVGETYATRLLYNNYLAGEYPNYTAGNADNVHFQEMGAIEMAKLVVQNITELSADANMSKLIPYIKTQYQIAVAASPLGNDSVTTRTTTYPAGLTIHLKTIPKVKTAFQKWNNAANTSIATTLIKTVTSGTAATNYTAIYAGSTICTAAITAPATSFCAGANIVLTANTGSSYQWYNGTTALGKTATQTVTAAGTYTVDVTNTSGCKATSVAKAIIVNTPTVPTITAPATSYCAGGSLMLTSSKGASYVWKNGTASLGTTITQTVTAAGSYTVDVTDANGCKATSVAKLITVNTPTVPTITAPSTSFCAGGSLVLTSSTGASYVWKNGTALLGTTITQTVTAAGSYTVDVTDANGCKATSVAKAITVNTPTVPTITSPSTSFCAGGSLVLTSSKGSSYIWKNGTASLGTTITQTVTVAGSYTVDVTDANGCKATSVAKVITLTNPNTCVVTAINDNQILEAQVSVIPQPFETNTTITLANGSEIESITVINSIGQTVYASNSIYKNQITIGENLAEGLYTVIIQSANGNFVTKIVKAG